MLNQYGPCPSSLKAHVAQAHGFDLEEVVPASVWRGARASHITPSDPREERDAEVRPSLTQHGIRCRWRQGLMGMRRQTWLKRGWSARRRGRASWLWRQGKDVGKGAFCCCCCIGCCSSWRWSCAAAAWREAGDESAGSVAAACSCLTGGAGDLAAACRWSGPVKEKEQVRLRGVPGGCTLLLLLFAEEKKAVTAACCCCCWSFLLLVLGCLQVRVIIALLLLAVGGKC